MECGGAVVRATSRECGGAVVRAPALESQGCEFNSHCVSTLATKLGLVSLSRKMSTWLRTVSTLYAPGKIVW